MPSSAQDTEAIRAARDPFANDVLERLIASNMGYQRSHGHYIVPLAQRLLATRLERDRLVARLEAAERERDEALEDCREVKRWSTRVVEQLCEARAALAAAAPGETTEPQ